MPGTRPPIRRFTPLTADRSQRLAGVLLASFSRRAVAFSVDFGIVVVFLGLLALPVTLRAWAATGDFVMNVDPFHGWELLSLPLYFGLSTFFGHGQSLGKRWLRIRVVSLTHEHLTLWQSIERSLGYGASVLEGGFGFVQYFIHPNGQTVHDRIAETVVVNDIGPALGQSTNSPAAS
jgi:uncharacterized RDD family membrane protein YckC